MEVGGKPKCIGVELEKGKSELSETGKQFQQELFNSSEFSYGC